MVEFPELAFCLRQWWYGRSWRVVLVSAVCIRGNRKVLTQAVLSCLSPVRQKVAYGHMSSQWRGVILPTIDVHKVGYSEPALQSYCNLQPNRNHLLPQQMQLSYFSYLAKHEIG